jgi:hypothetical protein
MLKKLFNSKSKILNLALAVLLSVSFLLNIFLAIRLSQNDFKPAESVEKTVGYFDEDNSSNSSNPNIITIPPGYSAINGRTLTLKRKETQDTQQDPELSSDENIKPRLNSWGDLSLIEKAYLTITNPKSHFEEIKTIVNENPFINDCNVSEDLTANIIQRSMDELTEDEIIQRGLIVLASQLIEQDINESMTNLDYEKISKQTLEKSCINIGNDADNLESSVEDFKGDLLFGKKIERDNYIIITSISAITSNSTYDSEIKNFIRAQSYLAMINEIAHFLVDKGKFLFPGVTEKSDTQNLIVDEHSAYSYTGDNGKEYFFIRSTGPDLIASTSDRDFERFSGFGEAISSSLSEIYRKQLSDIGDIPYPVITDYEFSKGHENLVACFQFIFFLKSNPEYENIADILLSENVFDDLSSDDKTEILLSRSKDVYNVIDQVRKIESLEDLFGIFSSSDEFGIQFYQYVNDSRVLKLTYLSGLPLENSLMYITTTHLDINKFINDLPEEKKDKIIQLYYNAYKQSNLNPDLGLT